MGRRDTSDSQAAPALAGAASSSDVVVVGGGIVGMATALELARAGARVTLLERTACGSGASTTAVGILSPAQSGAWQARGAWFARAQRAWREWAAGIGAGPDVVRWDGVLRVAHDDDAASELAAVEAAMDEVGVPLEDVDAAAVVPGIAQPLVARFEPRAGTVDTPALMPLLRAAAVDAGVGIVEPCPVTALAIDGGRCVGAVATDGAVHAASVVVAAAGGWSGSLPWLAPHLAADVRPLAGEVVVAGVPRDVPAPLPVGILAAPGAYAPRDGGRTVALGASFYDRGLDDRPSVGGVAEVLARALRVLPALAGCAVREVRVGFRPATPDESPLVGESSLPGLWLATGHHRNGILAAPLAAAELAAAVAAG